MTMNIGQVEVFILPLPVAHCDISDIITVLDRTNSFQNKNKKQNVANIHV